MKMKMCKRDGGDEVEKVFTVDRFIIEQDGNIVTLSREGLINEGNLKDFSCIIVGSGKDMKDKGEWPKSV